MIRSDYLLPVVFPSSHHQVPSHHPDWKLVMIVQVEHFEPASAHLVRVLYSVAAVKHNTYLFYLSTNLVLP